MAELNSFGMVMTFAIDLEARFTAYYTALGADDAASAADKRRVKLERIRREHVVEITLEPIDDFYDDAFAFQWDDPSPTAQAANRASASAFYASAAPRINVKPAARALERAGEEHQE